MKRLILILMLLATPVAAVEPDEILDDPALEARARDLSKELRCLVCQNESIDESNAELAKDLRVLVRERLVAGDTDAQVIDYVVGRYGDFVLLRPRFTGATIILWLTAPVLLLIAGIGAAVVIRTRARTPAAAPLTAEEEARLKHLLDDPPS